MSSIYSIDDFANRNGKFQKMSVYSKLAFFFLLLASIVVSRNLSVLALIPVSVYLLALIGSLPILKIFKWALYPTFFALIFAISQGDIYFGSVILLRAFSAASLALFFSFCTPYHKTFGVFSKVSPFLASMLFLTYRYFFIFVSGVERKIKMVEIRGGKNKKFQSVGRVIGFFIISFLNKSEEMYKILKVRGFKGKIGSTPDFKFGLGDFLLVSVAVLIFIITLNYV